MDEFYNKYDKEIDKRDLKSSDGKHLSYRKASLSDNEIMTILIAFQFGSFRNFKHYYLFLIRQYLKSTFPNAVSYNRFVKLQSQVFFLMIFFLNLSSFEHYMDSTMMPIYHNLKRYTNKVSREIATDSKGTIGWC